MLHYEFAQAWIRTHAPDTERGAGLVEFLIIAAGVAVVAIGVVAIYTTVINNKANAINLG